ncbi:DUF839 domain-containing protein [Sphingomonas sabuli]|uniref:DUF839 domain-containing protein n=1 Tax=Sphingomonas sabuli TaxID=2764186 RepID=A0A7G9L1D3_9SPHN|nr:alkaline phosphatase PhoX [Sphingomonas sabuli]QNM82432.1 DUF839 domain-containing protein [Sphingomonas sabuli]
MTLNLDRRQFGASFIATAFAGLTASGCVTRRETGGVAGYGALVEDPNGLVDLPQGFSYRVISALGEPMDDGEPVPDNADGMGVFTGAGGRLILVRNHELKAHQPSRVTGTAYDHRGGIGLPGGTTTIVYNPASGRVERQHRSLAGTIRNCAGGTTPWRTWLSCEEDTSKPDGKIARDHGWVFEVPADHTGRVDPVPIKALGRFNHEAAAVDPATGIVYLTEDRDDSLLYRFLPYMRGRLARGGRLQALALRDGRRDSRNWTRADFAVRQPAPAYWLDVTSVESPGDNLRHQGAEKGALLFARGEGIHMGRGEVYFACTSGGAARLGQIMRLRIGRGDRPDALDLFFESTAPDQFNYGDNLTVAPSGDLYVCEDQYTDVVDNYIRGIRPDGTPFPFARLRLQTEWAGACFSPNGQTLFVNAFSPAKTLAITGPFRS